MTLRLSDEQTAKLRAAAERDGISMHAAVLKAVDDYLDRRTARVESPVPLAEPQQASIRTNLARRYGEGLIFAFTQNPGLIGGLRVQIGSDVFDGSVAARLAALETSF